MTNVDNGRDADAPMLEQTTRESEALATAPRAQLVHHIEDERGGKAQLVERVIVRHSDEINELVGALAAAQLTFGDIERTLTAQVESRRTGGKYSYSYETLADVIGATRKPLAEQGLVVMQFPFPGRESITLRTMLAHTSGQWIYNDLTVALPGGLDAQSVGSGITYLMRYARKAILGLAAYDEDGQAAVKTPVKPAQRVSQQAMMPDSSGGDVSPVSDQRVADAGKVQVTPVPQNVGVIVQETERDGAFFFQLDTGYVCATRDKVLMVGAHAAKQERRRVELHCHGPKRAGYAPTLDEIVSAGS